MLDVRFVIEGIRLMDFHISYRHGFKRMYVLKLKQNSKYENKIAIAPQALPGLKIVGLLKTLDWSIVNYLKNSLRLTQNLTYGEY